MYNLIFILVFSTVIIIIIYYYIIIYIIIYILFNNIIIIIYYYNNTIKITYFLFQMLNNYLEFSTTKLEFIFSIMSKRLSYYGMGWEDRKTEILFVLRSHILLYVYVCIEICMCHCVWKIQQWFVEPIYCVTYYTALLSFIIE